MPFPRKSVGEVARTTFVIAKGVPTEGSTIWQAPTKGSFVLRAQCSASVPGATLTYVVLDARARKNDESTNDEERMLSSGTVECGNGVTTQDSAGPLVSMVQIQFRHMSPQATRAYAVIVPE